MPNKTRNMWLWSAIAGLVFVILTLTEAYARPLGDLTGPWVLFVDDYHIDTHSGVERTYHAFRKHAGNPVMSSEKTWEGNSVYLYGTVLPKESGEGYRMWYHIADRQYRNAYAVSEDGFVWERPVLNLIEFDGSSQNNLFLQRTREDHMPQVIHTPWEPDVNRRYKLLNYDYGRTPPGHVASGFWGAYSPDGIHWTPVERNPVLHDPGDVGSFCWDPHTQRYIGYPKTFAPVRGYRRRCLGFTAATNFERWPNAELILVPDEYDDRWVTEDKQRTDFYGLSAFAYESMYIGFLWIFRITDGNNDGPIFCELVSSHDGVLWERQAAPRNPILPLGEKGAWDSGMVFTPNHPLVEGDVIKLFYSGFNHTHSPAGADEPRQASIGIATLRKDGFASLDAKEKPGIVTTWPLTGMAGELIVNADARGGWIKAEVLDASGQVLPGYSVNDCPGVLGDGTAQHLVWEKHSVLPERSEALRLRFVLSNASLYSFRAGERVRRAPGPRPARSLFTFEGEDGKALLDEAGLQTGRLTGNVALVRGEESAVRGTGALAFTGGGDEPATLEIPDTRHLGNAFTLAAWVRTTKGGIQRMFSTYRGSGDFATGELVFDCNPHSGVLRFIVNGRRVHSQPRFFRDGKYHHFAAVYDGGHVRLYLDGEEVGRGRIPAVTSHLFHDRSIIEHAGNGAGPSLTGIHLGANLRVGEDQPGRFITYRDEAFNSREDQLEGWVDDVFVEKRALSAQEIMALAVEAMSQTRSRPPPRR